jgi:hypothetical protein
LVAVAEVLLVEVELWRMVLARCCWTIWLSMETKPLQGGGDAGSLLRSDEDREVIREGLGAHREVISRTMKAMRRGGEDLLCIEGRHAVVRSHLPLPATAVAKAGKYTVTEHWIVP